MHQQKAPVESQRLISRLRNKAEELIETQHLSRTAKKRSINQKKACDVHMHGIANLPHNCRTVPLTIVLET
jgi:hypothetical protein